MINDKKVIFLYLPPADIDSPSAAFSILKSFLNENNCIVEIKYWNLLLFPILKKYYKDIVSRLIPFISILSDKNDNSIDNRIIMYLKKERISKNSCNIKQTAFELNDVKCKINLFIKNELSKVDFPNVKIIGFTSKFFQWIPGMIIAEEIKKNYPDIKIVIGGFSTKESAIEVLKLCKYFDFGIWGEGEYSILELCEEIEKSEPNYHKVQKLIFREDNSIKINTSQKNKYLDFENYIYPNYEDYFKCVSNGTKIKNIKLPINAVRGCNWNQCKFCVSGKGYLYRERNKKDIIKEIEFHSKMYNILDFIFVDNVSIGMNDDKFEEFIDMIIISKNKKGLNYRFQGTLIPINMSSEIIKKMHIAGYKTTQIGYEAVTDSMLKKMDKQHDFSDNLLFLKFATKFNIFVPGLTIIGIPDETSNDIQESIKNLHYLRFVLADSKYSHEYIDLELYKNSKYDKIIKEKMKEEYNHNIINYYLPNNLIDDKNRFNLLGYSKKIRKNSIVWNKFMSIERFYKKAKYNYKISYNNDMLYYDEFQNENKIISITFNELQIEILRILNNQIYSFEILFKKISKHNKMINKAKLKSIIYELESKYLIYCNKELSRIVSIIDINNGYIE